jgi:hypothetical protein
LQVSDSLCCHVRLVVDRAIARSLADNIVLKCHNSFLVPMSEHLYGEIQQKVTRLTDVDLDTMFEVRVCAWCLQRQTFHTRTRIAGQSDD